jgi:RHS repeat-associated protein
VERYDRDGNLYDQFSYKYAERDGRLERNRLYQLNDLADATNLYVNEPTGAKDIAYTGDVPFAPEATNVNSAYNYRYDQLGNLIKDEREGIVNIQWTVAGKVKQVEKTDGTVLTFAYGADGQRLWKEVTPPVLDDTGYREYYIRDAQGNIMATYRSQLLVVPSPEPQGYAASLRVTERPVYGSSRLGSYARAEELYDHPVVSTPAPDPVQPVDLHYELTDHLGNVTVVVTGRLLSGNGGGTPKQAELVSAQGYEAFGALLPGRNYSSDSYRFGFQGQEKDDEMHGATGTSYAFEYRIHDPRVGRFLSIDPLTWKYPYWSPYAFAGNMVIQYVELEGLEINIIKLDRIKSGRVTDIRVRRAEDVAGNVIDQNVTRNGVNYQGYAAIIFDPMNSDPSQRLRFAKDLADLTPDERRALATMSRTHTDKQYKTIGGDMHTDANIFQGSFTPLVTVGRPPATVNGVVVKPGAVIRSDDVPYVRTSAPGNPEEGMVPSYADQSFLNSIAAAVMGNSSIKEIDISMNLAIAPNVSNAELAYTRRVDAMGVESMKQYLYDHGVSKDVKINVSSTTNRGDQSSQGPSTTLRFR